MERQKIVLASKSPTRKEEFNKLNIAFETKVSDVDENSLKKIYTDPKELVMKLAELKAEKVAETCENSIVIASDSMIFFENKIIGKPKTHEEAVQMLLLFSGKEQSIISGLCIIDTNTHKKTSEFIDMHVVFNELDKEKIEKYFSSFDPTNRAGAYNIRDGIEKGIIKCFDGSIENCVGLDFEIINKVLENAGYLSKNE